MDIRALVFDPDEFYTAPIEDYIRISTAVVLLAAILKVSWLAYGSYLVVQATDIGGELIGIGITLLFGLMVFVLVAGWLLISGVFFWISKLFDGQGNFRSLAMYVAWGFTPQALSSIYSVITIAVLLRPAEISGSVRGSVTGIAQVNSHPAVVAGSILSAACLVWTAFLWIFAVKHARQLSLREAMYTVAPVAGPLVLHSISQLPIW